MMHRTAFLMGLMATWCFCPPANVGAPEPGEQLPEGAEVHRGLVYSKVDVELKLDLWVPSRSAKPAPCVIFIEGGGFSARDGQRAGPFSEYLAENGIAAAGIAHRGRPNHTYRDTIADIKAAVRYVRKISGKHGIDPDRIGAMGGSSGGTLAVMLAVTGGTEELEGEGGHPEFSSRVQAAVGCAGVYDFVARFTDKRHIEMQMDPEKRIVTNGQWVGAPFSATNEHWLNAFPITYADETNAPILLLHCKDDPIVPWLQSEEMHARLQEVGAQSEIELYETGGHGLGVARLKPRALAFFNKVLGE